MGVVRYKQVVNKTGIVSYNFHNFFTNLNTTAIVLRYDFNYRDVGKCHNTTKTSAFDFRIVYF